MAERQGKKESHPGHSLPPQLPTHRRDNPSDADSALEAINRRVDSLEDTIRELKEQLAPLLSK